MLDTSGAMAFTWERVATKIALSTLKIQLSVLGKRCYADHYMQDRLLRVCNNDSQALERYPCSK